MNTNEVIILARKHIGNGAAMDSSARLCLADAIALQNAGDLESAKRRAIKSLAYSVGHPARRLRPRSAQKDSRGRAKRISRPPDRSANSHTRRYENEQLHQLRRNRQIDPPSAERIVRWRQIQRQKPCL